MFTFILSKIKWTKPLLMVVLLPSCGSNVFRNDTTLNESALYDPPHITLKEGVEYRFSEGVLIGRGQKFHSEWSYRRAVVIGSSK